jgi:two-component system KDP operon response regulator KdpE
MNRHRKILVVDNDKALRLLIKTKFESNGFEVHCTDNAVDGIKHFTAEKFDLVMTDINLPTISGNILVRYVRNLCAGVPIIALTAAPGLAQEIFDMVVEKPFGLTFLLDSIAYFLTTEEEMTGEQTLQLCV